MQRLGVLMLTMGVLGCHGGGDATDTPAAGAQKGESGVPVQLATARTQDFTEVVEAPGATQALSLQKVRAPFAGVLVAFHAVDGQRVKRGDALATLLSDESVAAVNGAQAMANAASDPKARSEAARALALAKRGEVRRTLRAPVSGIVLSHAAAQGDRVGAGDELLALADPSAIVFVAQVVQTEVSRLHAGQKAEVALAAMAKPVPARVHGVLPAASAQALSSPVRLDLKGEAAAVGLFGSARIAVAVHRAAVGVPEAALLRDDVSGVTRVARVDGTGKARWVEVTPGLREKGWVELTGGKLSAGDRVVTGGQVGLPEGATVVEAR
jgi:membrane fusion protein (multidrug efflux system)